MPKSQKRLICCAHDEIIELADKLENLDYPEHIGKKVRKIIKKIVAVAEEARVYGQSMEDRLRDYRNSIEELGFKRKK